VERGLEQEAVAGMEGMETEEAEAVTGAAILSTMPSRTLAARLDIPPVIKAINSGVCL
jgi:hypothetical protein